MEANLDFEQNDWGVYASCYDTLMHLTPYQELMKQVSTELNIKHYDDLLDVCCGTGNLLNKLDCNGLYGTLTGVDFSPEMLVRAQGKFENYPPTLIHADVNLELPFSDDSFSKVVSVNALYALNNPPATIQEIYRVLKAKGEVVLVTPKHNFDNGLVLKAHARSHKPDSYWKNAHASPEREEKLIREAINDEEIIQQMLYVARHNRAIAQTMTFHFFSVDELKCLFEENGFTVVKVTPAYANQGILIHAHK